MSSNDVNRQSRIAQWAFDTRGVLGRFHLWLEDVDEVFELGTADMPTFTGSALERGLVMTTAVTALGTRLFGSHGEGAGTDKATLNRVKKDADAVSAYAMSEGLWYLTRALPENHAVMVSLGEGLMPKAGETPEMGSNPLLGFGRVYARPEVARYLDDRVRELLNDDGYGWADFWRDVNDRGLTVWGAAIDTLENTSRFAKGSSTGPMAVLHLFDQPLNVAKPYEGYMGSLTLPNAVVAEAEKRAILCDYRTPRAKVLECALAAYPGLTAENVHVWTLGGPSRQARLGGLWDAWRSLGVHVVEDGWRLPGGGETFNESGTYAPIYRVGPLDVDGETHLFLCDGYAASAEAIQAASLDPVLDVTTSMVLFSSEFEVSCERESEVMGLSPDEASFARDLAAVLGRDVDALLESTYASIIRHAASANLPLGKRTLTIDDVIPMKQWRVLALSGCMCPDPYSGMPGVEEVAPSTFRVTVRAATRQKCRRVTLTLRLMESMDESRRVFSPLLDRFYAGENYRQRPVKISDSGRIRNELMTWCSEALEFNADGTIGVDLARVDDAVLPPDKKTFVMDVLRWYHTEHPFWFKWLSLSDG